MSSPIDPNIEAIRSAVYGRDVREAIASGLELCYETAASAVYEIATTTETNAIITEWTPPVYESN